MVHGAHWNLSVVWTDPSIPILQDHTPSLLLQVISAKSWGILSALGWLNFHMNFGGPHHIPPFFRTLSYKLQLLQHHRSAICFPYQCDHHSAWTSPPCTLHPRKMLQAASGQLVGGLTLFPLSSNDKSEFQMWASTAISVDNSVHHCNSTSAEFSGVWSLVWVVCWYNRSSIVSDYHWACESHTQLCCLVLLVRTTRVSQAPPQTAHPLVLNLVAKHPGMLVLGASCIPVTLCSATWCACGEWPVSRWRQTQSPRPSRSSDKRCTLCSSLWGHVSAHPIRLQVTLHIRGFATRGCSTYPPPHLK